MTINTKKLLHITLEHKWEFGSYNLYNYLCHSCGESFSDYDGNKYRSEECKKHKDCEIKAGGE